MGIAKLLMVTVSVEQTVMYMMTVVLMSTVLNVNETIIIRSLMCYCCCIITQIQEHVGILVSPRAAVMSQVMDFAMSTSEMLTTVDAPAM